MPRNCTTKTERHTVWTPAEEAMLVSGVQSGMSLGRMADALRKTPGSITWKLNALGLPKGNPDATGPSLDTVTLEDYRARQSDLAFKRAMLKAIAAGTEKAVPCVVRARRPSATFRVCAPPPIAAIARMRRWRWSLGQAKRRPRKTGSAPASPPSRQAAEPENASSARLDITVNEILITF